MKYNLFIRVGIRLQMISPIIKNIYFNYWSQENDCDKYKYIILAQR